MLTLYGFLLGMLLLAFTILWLGLRKTPVFKQMLVLLFLMAGVSLSVYQFSGDKPQLYAWLTKGSEHYALMQNVAELGGIDGLIEKVKAKLASNPDDPEGQRILDKLYAAKSAKKSA